MTAKPAEISSTPSKARAARSVAPALQEASDPSGNSEDIARLYTELATSFGSDDSEAVRLIYRELLRRGRPRAEILAEVARAAAAQEPKPIASGSLVNATPPVGVAAVTQTAGVHAQSRLDALPASAGSRPTHDQQISEGRALPQKDSKTWRRLPLNVRTLIRTPAACFTPLAAATGTAILISLMISADATSSFPTREATAPSTQSPATPFQLSATQPFETPASAPAERASGGEFKEAVPHLSAEDVAMLRTRGDALLSMGDVTSSRLFYERAVAVGDAQAAIRLGATYDPIFLSQARLRNVPADMAVALDWYRRARDLGAVEAESLLRSVEGK
jgi:hypothetical protein